jgi:two-component system, cell cycle sensor histidine kinase and response regulator CckA
VEPIARLTLDRSGTIVDANEQAGHLLVGTGRSSPVGRPLASFVAADDQESLAHHLSATLSGGRTRCDLHLASGDRCLRIESHVMEEAGELRIVTALIEITDLERAQAELSDRLAQMSAVTEAASDAILLIEERGAISSLNAAAVEMFGHAPEEAIGRTAALLVPALAPALARGLRGESLRAGSGHELTGRRRDGTTFPVEISAAEWTGEGGRGYALLLRDLSRRNRLEEEFLQAQKMEAIGRLAAGVAHDFNNLLMGISGCATVALDRLDGHEEVRELLDEIVSAAASGASITRQLLEFGRKRKHSPRLLDLDSVVFRSEAMLRRLLGEDIELLVRCNAAGAMVRCDPGQIEQVLMNLIVNARDAMPSGGRLIIETSEVEIAREEALRRWVRLRVSDTGCGMDEEIQEYLFEPFFTTKSIGEGTGLGLSTVYAIVERSGGQIDLASEIGVGTTFTIHLPCADPNARAQTPVPGGTTADRSGTILVVEDQPMVRETIRYYLERRGYRVLEARDGVEGLEMYRDHAEAIDMLLTDVVLPGVVGTELARRIHALEPGIPVLYMSAYPRESLVDEGRMAPGMAALQKPFTEEELLASVRAALGEGFSR